MPSPTVYLAMAPSEGTYNTRMQTSGLLQPPPTVYLAHLPGAPCDNALIVPDGTRKMLTGKVIDDASRPPILISYVFVQAFLKEQPRYRYRQWVLDSGAFSAQRSGAVIDLDVYTEFCKERLAVDPTLQEVFALDVIGDWRASVRNAEYMWAKGVPAIPTFHHGSPEDVLKALARDYPKIALGNMVGLKPKPKKHFAEQCFARVWPKAIHGFGVGTRALLMAVPWHSVDATNWEIGPCKYGHWQSFGRAPLRIRGSQQDLRSEIRWYAEMEKMARHRWRTEMQVLDGQLRAAGWRGYETAATT